MAKSANGERSASIVSSSEGVVVTGAMGAAATGFSYCVTAVTGMVAAARVGARGWYTDPGMVAPGVVSHAVGDEDGPEGATQLVGIAAHEDVGAEAADDGQVAGAGMLLESAMLLALILAHRSSKYAWSGTQRPMRGRGAAAGRSYCVTFVSGFQ